MVRPLPTAQEAPGLKSLRFSPGTLRIYSRLVSGNTRRSAAARLLIALGILIAAPHVHAQIDPQAPDSTAGSVLNSGDSCPDGSSPIAQSDGTTSCPSGRANAIPAVTGSIPRPGGVASSGENSQFANPISTANSLQFRKLPPEPLTEFQKFVAATTGQILPIYGADLFRNVPATFSPNDLGPVSSNYVIGPDDELRIRIWGQVNYSGNLRVDRSGDIYIPEVGQIHVAGLQFSALDQHLRSAIGRVYRNFDLNADMGRIRSIQVYVAGQARRPGVYTVSSLSTLVDAIFASGGPSPQGSLRHIELRRNGSTVTEFDLYDLLIHGDKSKDVHLLPEDVVFFPPVGRQAAITGAVRNPAIYELKDNETIGGLIASAGNATALASDARISLERSADRQQRQAMEFAYDTAGLSAPLSDGDIVRVYSILPSYRNTVTLRGYLANPGRFAWKPGLHLSDLIPDQDSLLSRDYWWKRSHLGLPSPEFEPFLQSFETDIKYPQRSDQHLTSGAQTEITPSTVPYANQRSIADPASPEAQAQFSRDLAESQNPQTQAGENQSPQLYEGDDPADESRQHNPGSGALAAGSANPANQQNQSHPVRTDVHLSAPDIDWQYAVIERVNPKTLRTSLIPFDLGKLVLQHDPAQNLELQPGDVVSVFSQDDIRVPVQQQTKYVRLEGEFVHSGIYSAEPGETLRDLVRRAGGFTANAYLYGSEFDRESTRRLQQQRIDDYVRRVDLDASRGTLALMASSTSPQGNINAAGATSAEQALLERLKQIRATGRVVLAFQPNSDTIDSVPSIPLENGDRFIVPSTPATVNVVGAVYDQNSFLYHPHSRVDQYLKDAGGPDRNADWRHSFVIRADGSVVSRESVRGPWGNTFKELHLNPGDTIVVPDKTLRPTALRGILDWTQIFSQLAFGAAAINVIR